MANRHTIILMQTSPNRATRTFMDYDSISQAMDGICGLYERKLKELNPAIRNITYDIGDLYNFIDGLADMSALVYNHSIQAYLPYDRQWIKQRTFQHLNRIKSNRKERVSITGSKAFLCSPNLSLSLSLSHGRGGLLLSPAHIFRTTRTFCSIFR
ncbi:enhancer of rudimentary homolog isoform X1 [Malania oleifera]|uniref:enhancer of rudimentary homolog isoform X1 n=1 Tax=Malania oleifera TaxID=397392 RepID=UPI0025AE3B15|nr:enhancer of rudimentary homolog isoform X1 [Malania oleifera]